jgi:hypothetical protein
LNARSLKERVVARYLYEHLFLAHLHFAKEMPSEFFRIIRSSRSCEEGPKEIPSLRPYDDPGPSYFYCLQKVTGVITDKIHIVYEVGDERLKRWRELFMTGKWEPREFPKWGLQAGANPFVTFQDIPAQARYQFLLDDAQYHIMTFIKGPVCRGSSAVNSIDEQFWVLFLKPESDHFVKDPSYAQQVSPKLYLPSMYGSSVEHVAEGVGYALQLVRDRNFYREQRDIQYGKDRPAGYELNDIWDGDGHNSNALLTILRHYDSAHVLKGAVGPIPKTAFVLDYPLFERLVYDLVTGFDIFGNVGHQVLTRITMGHIRMEGEENFLAFLPAEIRKKLRDSWYRSDSFWTNEKMELWYPLLPKGKTLRPTNVKYKSPASAKEEFWEQVLTNYLKPEVRGWVDRINCCGPAPQEPLANRINSVEELEHELRKLTGVRAEFAPYVRFMQDATLVRVVVNGGEKDLLYTMVRNKEHTNLAWINGEEKRRDEDADVLVVIPGAATSYPNRYFVVQWDEVPQFLKAAQNLRNVSDAAAFVKRWGIRRDNPSFWKYHEWFNARHIRDNPVDNGILDLNRYENYGNPGGF